MKLSKFKRLFYASVLFLTACQSVDYQQKSPYSTKVQQEVLFGTQAHQGHLVEAEAKQNKPVIAYVLGSGGARGYAHIGVLQVLEKNGIFPDFIVGTSAGSMVGALYAYHQNVDAVQQVANSLEVSDVRDFSINLQGFFDGKKVEEFVNKQVQHTNLEKLHTPMYVVATRLDNGEKVVFNQGNTGQAVRASVSIPMMFNPVKIGSYEYVDGGLASPVPVKVAKELGADMVIAVNILAQPYYTKTDNLWGLFNQNINIMQNHMAKEELSYADIVIQPDIREKAHIFDVKGRDKTVLAGQQAAQAKVAEIQQKIAQLKQEYEQKQLNDTPQSEP